MTEPRFGKGVYIAEGAIVRGNVDVGDDASIWFNAVVRSEESPVIIGKCSNIQDNAVIHADPWNQVKIGDHVTIGHGAIVHGCTVGNDTVIGMGAIVMNEAVIGTGCIVGAGALVTERTVIPDYAVVVGSPARIIRQADAETAQKNKANAEHYAELAKAYRMQQSR